MSSSSSSSRKIRDEDLENNFEETRAILDRHNVTGVDAFFRQEDTFYNMLIHPRHYVKHRTHARFFHISLRFHENRVKIFIASLPIGSRRIFLLSNPISDDFYLALLRKEKHTKVSAWTDEKETASSRKYPNDRNIVTEDRELTRREINVQEKSNPPFPSNVI